MLAQRHKRVTVRDRQLISRLERERDRLRREELLQWLPIHHQLAESQRALTILPAADAILDQLKPAAQLCQRILVENIRRATFRFTVSNTGRCFNGLTGLKRELRKVVHLAGQPIGGVDIRCAQPALLTILARLNGGQNVPTYISALLSLASSRSSACFRPCSGLPGLELALSLPADVVLLEPDFVSFESLVVGGNLYEQLIADCRAAEVALPERDDEAREEVKRLMMRDVLAKKGRYRSSFEDVFRRAFPSIHRLIRWINQNDHAELIRTLQRLESWLVIENVAPRLLDRCPTVTLHDAIYAGIEDLPAVEDAFQETFEEWDVRLRVKVETSW